MKLNESAAFGWRVAATSQALLALTSFAWRTDAGDLLGGGCLCAALVCAYRAGRDSTRSANADEALR